MLGHAAVIHNINRSSESNRVALRVVDRCKIAFMLPRRGPQAMPPTDFSRATGVDRISCPLPGAPFYSLDTAMLCCATSGSRAPH